MDCWRVWGRGSCNFCSATIDITYYGLSRLSFLWPGGRQVAGWKHGPHQAADVHHCNVLLLARQHLCGSNSGISAALLLHLTLPLQSIRISIHYGRSLTPGRSHFSHHAQAMEDDSTLSGFRVLYLLTVYVPLGPPPPMLTHMCRTSCNSMKSEGLVPSLCASRGTRHMSCRL